MSKLASCSHCEGFVPESAARCPNCGAAAPAVSWWLERAGLWLKAAGGGAVAMTLMACYGPPPGERWDEPVDPAAAPKTEAEPAKADAKESKADAKAEPTKAEPTAAPEAGDDAKTPDPAAPENQ